MKEIKVLLQGEKIPDIVLETVERGKKAHDLLEAAARHRAEEAEGDFHVFVENSDEPLKAEDDLPSGESGQPIRLHVHRCSRITVKVTFNGVTKEHHYGPGTPVATVKKWAAIKAFGMNPTDGAEHVLQLAGTTDRPEPDTHIGALVGCPDCSLAFDLVPLVRVEG